MRHDVGRPWYRVFVLATVILAAGCLGSPTTESSVASLIYDSPPLATFKKGFTKAAADAAEIDVAKAIGRAPSETADAKASHKLRKLDVVGINDDPTSDGPVTGTQGESSKGSCKVIEGAEAMFTDVFRASNWEWVDDNVYEAKHKSTAKKEKVKGDSTSKFAQDSHAGTHAATAKLSKSTVNPGAKPKIKPMRTLSDAAELITAKFGAEITVEKMESITALELATFIHATGLDCSEFGLPAPPQDIANFFMSLDVDDPDDLLGAIVATFSTAAASEAGDTSGNKSTANNGRVKEASNAKTAQDSHAAAKSKLPRSRVVSGANTKFKPNRILMKSDSLSDAALFIKVKFGAEISVESLEKLTAPELALFLRATGLDISEFGLPALPQVLVDYVADYLESLDFDDPEASGDLLDAVVDIFDDFAQMVARLEAEAEARAHLIEAAITKNKALTSFGEPFSPVDYVHDGHPDDYDRATHPIWEYNDVDLAAAQSMDAWQRYPDRIEYSLESLMELGAPMYMYRPGKPENDNNYELRLSRTPPPTVATRHILIDDMKEVDIYVGGVRQVRRRRNPISEGLTEELIVGLVEKAIEWIRDDIKLTSSKNHAKVVEISIERIIKNALRIATTNEKPIIDEFSRRLREMDVLREIRLRDEIAEIGGRETTVKEIPRNKNMEEDLRLRDEKEGPGVPRTWREAVFETLRDSATIANCFDTVIVGLGISMAIHMYLSGRSFYQVVFFFALAPVLFRGLLSGPSGIYYIISFVLSRLGLAVPLSLLLILRGARPPDARREAEVIEELLEEEDKVPKRARATAKAAAKATAKATAKASVKANTKRRGGASAAAAHQQLPSRATASPLLAWSGGSAAKVLPFPLKWALAKLLAKLGLGGAAGQTAAAAVEGAAGAAEAVAEAVAAQRAEAASGGGAGGVSPGDGAHAAVESSLASRLTDAACSRCGSSSVVSSDVTLRPCSRCKTTLYCGPECQKADWQAHKLLCSAPMQAAGRGSNARSKASQAQAKRSGQAQQAPPLENSPLELELEERSELEAWAISEAIAQSLLTERGSPAQFRCGSAEACAYCGFGEKGNGYCSEECHRAHEGAQKSQQSGGGQGGRNKLQAVAEAVETDRDGGGGGGGGASRDLSASVAAIFSAAPEPAPTAFTQALPPAGVPPTVPAGSDDDGSDWSTLLIGGDGDGAAAAEAPAVQTTRAAATTGGEALAEKLRAHGLGACVEAFLAEDYDLEVFTTITRPLDLASGGRFIVPERLHGKILALAAMLRRESELVELD